MMAGMDHFFWTDPALARKLRLAICAAATSLVSLWRMLLQSRFVRSNTNLMASRTLPYSGDSQCAKAALKVGKEKDPSGFLVSGMGDWAATFKSSLRAVMTPPNTLHARQVLSVVQDDRERGGTCPPIAHRNSNTSLTSHYTPQLQLVQARPRRRSAQPP